MPEKAVTVKQMACMAGVSQEFVRAACWRSPENHPLPHLRSGEIRPVIRIRPSAYEKWVAEEELMQNR